MDAAPGRRAALTMMGLGIGAGGRAEHPARSLGSSCPSPKFSILKSPPRAWQGHGVPGPPQQPVKLVAVRRRAGLRRFLASTALFPRIWALGTREPRQRRLDRLGPHASRLVRLLPCSVPQAMGYTVWPFVVDEATGGLKRISCRPLGGMLEPEDPDGGVGDEGCERSSWGWRSTIGASSVCSES